MLNQADNNSKQNLSEDALCNYIYTVAKSSKRENH